MSTNLMFDRCYYMSWLRYSTYRVCAQEVEMQGRLRFIRAAFLPLKPKLILVRHPLSHAKNGSCDPGKCAADGSATNQM